MTASTRGSTTLAQGDARRYTACTTGDRQLCAASRPIERVPVENGPRTGRCWPSDAGRERRS